MEDSIHTHKSIDVLHAAAAPVLVKQRRVQPDSDEDGHADRSGAAAGGAELECAHLPPPSKHGPQSNAAVASTAVFHSAMASDPWLSTPGAAPRQDGQQQHALLSQRQQRGAAQHRPAQQQQQQQQEYAAERHWRGQQQHVQPHRPQAATFSAAASFSEQDDSGDDSEWELGSSDLVSDSDNEEVVNPARFGALGGLLSGVLADTAAAAAGGGGRRATQAVTAGSGRGKKAAAHSAANAKGGSSSRAVPAQRQRQQASRQHSAPPVATALGDAVGDLLGLDGMGGEVLYSLLDESDLQQQQQRQGRQKPVHGRRKAAGAQPQQKQQQTQQQEQPAVLGRSSGPASESPSSDDADGVDADEEDLDALLLPVSAAAVGSEEGDEGLCDDRAVAEVESILSQLQHKAAALQAARASWGMPGVAVGRLPAAAGAGVGTRAGKRDTAAGARATGAGSHARAAAAPTHQVADAAAEQAPSVPAAATRQQQQTLQQQNPADHRRRTVLQRPPQAGAAKALQQQQHQQRCAGAGGDDGAELDPGLAELLDEALFAGLEGPNGAEQPSTGAAAAGSDPAAAAATANPDGHESEGGAPSVRRGRGRGRSSSRGRGRGRGRGRSTSNAAKNKQQQQVQQQDAEQDSPAGIPAAAPTGTEADLQKTAAAAAAAAGVAAAEQETGGCHPQLLPLQPHPSWVPRAPGKWRERLAVMQTALQANRELQAKLRQLLEGVDQVGGQQGSW